MVSLPSLLNFSLFCSSTTIYFTWWASFITYIWGSSSMMTHSCSERVEGRSWPWRRHHYRRTLDLVRAFYMTSFEFLLAYPSLREWIIGSFRSWLTRGSGLLLHCGTCCSDFDLDIIVDQNHHHGPRHWLQPLYPFALLKLLLEPVLPSVWLPWIWCPLHMAKKYI